MSAVAATASAAVAAAAAATPRPCVSGGLRARVEQVTGHLEDCEMGPVAGQAVFPQSY